MISRRRLQNKLIHIAFNVRKRSFSASRLCNMLTFIPKEEIYFVFFMAYIIQDIITILDTICVELVAHQ